MSVLKIQPYATDNTANFVFNGLTVTSNISSGNANLGNAVIANYYYGNGINLTGITATNANFANYAGNVTVAAQSNITSVGTLSSLTVSGLLTATSTGIKVANIQDSSGTISISTKYNNVAGDIGITGNLTVGTSGTGNVTANYFIGNGSQLTGLTATNANFANYAGNVTGASQSNITSVGTLSGLTVSGTSTLTGNVAISGNLSVTGNTTYVNSNVSVIVDPVIELGSGANGAALSSNDSMDRGTLLHYYTSTTVDAFMGWKSANNEFTFASNASVTNNVATINTLGNIRAGNAVLGNSVTSNYFIGSGNNLSNIQASNITGTVANANYAAYAGNVILAAQSNITSLGTLSSLSVTGNVTSGNANLGNALTANYFIGSGNNLSNIQGSNVSGQVGNALVAGTVYTNAQPNITSVGTLNGLTSNSVVNFTGASNVALGAVGNVHITGGSTGQYLQTDGSGNLSWVTLSISTSSISNGNSNVNIPSANGNVNISAVGNANIVTVTGTGVNVFGTLNATGNANVGNIGATGVVATTLGGALTTASQPNITSLGTLSGLTISGNAVIVGNLVVTGNTTYVNSNITQIQDPLLEIGGGANGAALSSNDSFDRGTLLHYYTSTTVDAFMGWKSANSEFVFASNASVTNNVTTINTLGNIRAGNAQLGNLVTANYFTGNGSLLTGVARATATDSVANGLSNVNIASANANATISINGTSNVVVVSNTSVVVTGNLTSTNANLGNAVTANYFVGNGSLLTGVAKASAADSVANGLSNVNIASANANATISINGTSNVVVVSNTSVVVTGNLTSTNANLGNNVTANFFTGSGAYLTSVVAVTAGTVTTNAQPNITTVGTLANLIVGNATANTTMGNGTITATGNISFTGANVSLGAVGNLKITGGTSGYFLSTDGAGNLSWAATSGGGGGTVAGSNTQVQYNNASVLGGSANFTFNNTNNTLSVDRAIHINGANLGSNIANIYIGGGSNAQVLSTDGAGNLSWIAQTTATITVDNFTGNGVQTTFTLSVTPTSINQVIVNYNGSFQLRSAYSLSGANIIFTEAPYNGSLIEVTTTQGIKSGAGAFTNRTYTGNGVAVNFAVTNGVSATSLLVTENGVVQTPGTDYTVSGSTLTFTTAPTSAMTVQIRELAVAVATTSGLSVQLQGTNVAATANTINFVGGGDSVTASGNVVTVNQLSPFLLMGA